MMDEYILTIFLCDEAKALFFIEPFNDTISHSGFPPPPFKKFSWFQTSGGHFLTNGSFLQNETGT
jgi:hypothetical protein